MLITVITVFLFVRMTMYLALRYLKVSPLIALSATIASYTFAQQWPAVKDFTLFVAMGILPIFVLLWIIALQKHRFVYLLGALSGAAWMIHPIVGYTCTGLWVFLLF